MTVGRGGIQFGSLQYILLKEKLLSIGCLKIIYHALRYGFSNFLFVFFNIYHFFHPDLTLGLYCVVNFTTKYLLCIEFHSKYLSNYFPLYSVLHIKAEPVVSMNINLPEFWTVFRRAFVETSVLLQWERELSINSECSAQRTKHQRVRELLNWKNSY